MRLWRVMYILLACQSAGVNETTLISAFWKAPLETYDWDRRIVKIKPCYATSGRVSKWHQAPPLCKDGSNPTFRSSLRRHVREFLSGHYSLCRSSRDQPARNVVPTVSPNRNSINLPRPILHRQPFPIQFFSHGFGAFVSVQPA